MWFRKNKDKENTSIWAKATSVSDLSKDIESLRETNKSLNDDIEKLKRIVKRAKDEPTYHLDYDVFFDMFVPSRRKYSLYIYVDKEEYIIELDELSNENVDMNSAELEVKENIAYFNISSCMTFEGAKRWTKHKFTIEYKNGRYVYSQEEDKIRNDKEEVKLQIE